MRNTRIALFAFTVLGGYVLWRNRFAIQRQLETFGVKTPTLDGTLEETAKSIASQAAGKMEHGATIAENFVSRRMG
jgi:hypothetical protein